MHTEDAAALLFDLGGVVLDIDFERALAAWQPHSRWPVERLRELFVCDEPFRHHETGAITDRQYFGHLRGTLGLGCDDAAVEAGWNRIFVAPIVPTLDLIDAVRGRLPCYALSNTNDAHLRHMQAEFAHVLGRFDRVFVSHEIGHRKPQPQSFAHVVQAIGVPAAQVLFFDDLQENVLAARQSGLQAVLVRGPDDVREALLARRLLNAQPLE